MLIWLFILIDLVLWVAAFSWRPPELQSAPIVAVNIWPGTESMIAARESGLLKSGTINFVEMAWSSSAMRAFGNGAVDAAVLSLSEVQWLGELGHPFRILLVVDESVGADALVGRAGTTGVAELRGKKIGVEVRSSGHYLLARALDEAGMTLADVQMVPLILPETEAALEELGLDAVVTAEPWLTRIVSKGGAVIFDSSRMPGEIKRVLVVREEIMLGAHRSMGDLVDAHFVALDPADWSETVLAGIFRREGLNAQEFAEVRHRIRPFRREEQAGLLFGPDARLRFDLETVGEHMARLGLLSGEPGKDLVLDDTLTMP